MLLEKSTTGGQTTTGQGSVSTAKTTKRWEVWNVTTVKAHITSPSARNLKKKETGTNGDNTMLAGFSTSGRHFISFSGEMIVQSVSSVTTQPIIKCKSRTCLQVYAVTIISVKTPPNLDPQKLYECGETTTSWRCGSTMSSAQVGPQDAIRTKIPWLTLIKVMCISLRIQPSWLYKWQVKYKTSAA